MLTDLMMGIILQFHEFHHIANHGFLLIRYSLKQKVAELMQLSPEHHPGNAAPVVSCIHAISASRKKGSLSSQSLVHQNELPQVFIHCLHVLFHSAI
jgi:hypothetical protein